MKLTDRQQQIVDFLQSQHRQTGIMPSTREIQEHFGFASQTAAVSHLKALEKKGVITRLEGKARGLIFTDSLNREPIVDVPIYGCIPAGFGDDSKPESDGCLSVDIRSMGVSSSAKTYALRVRGDSMVNAHILDGDHVVIECKEPHEHDVVAALIDGETTLKRYVFKDSKPYLKAENANYPDLIPVRELVVQGVMVGLVRGSTRRW